MTADESRTDLLAKLDVHRESVRDCFNALELFVNGELDEASK